jgi:hypothetical protein
MKPSRIRILYRGRAGTTRKLLVDLLTQAGYTVSTETCADADVAPNASDLVILTQVKPGAPTTARPAARRKGPP